MQVLPSGIHTFERVINENKLYVDKTEYIYNLIMTGSVYFLSRPRRFGKSLLISTLKAIFEGKRDLFTDLWLGQQSDYDFEAYPVLHSDLSKANTESVADFKDYLLVQVNQWAREYGIELEHSTYNTRFGELLEKLGQNKPVVVLIDEYDKPILDNLTKPIRDEIKDTLKAFYTALKANDQYLRFILLSGVTKFSKISVFSGLNNLTDLTMSPYYAEMLGFTQVELEHYFAPHIDHLAQTLGLTKTALLDKIRFWYNGYRFSSKDMYVYNPFSTLLLFTLGEFKFHWFETGTPTFLLELIKSRPSSWGQIPDEKLVSERAFSTYEVERLETLPLLFQSGYLTIKGLNDSFDERLYLLDYPNYEVRKAFLAEVLRHFSDIAEESNYIYRLVHNFKQGDIEAVLELLKVFFANISYELHLKYENYYQSIFFAIFELLGFNIQAETRTNSERIGTNRGRIDAVVDLPDIIYLFEFKLFDTAESALKQIKTNRYFEKYRKLDKTILMVGVAFDKDERNIGDWLIETMNKANR